MSSQAVSLQSTTQEPMRLNSPQYGKLANRIAEYLPLPEHRLFQKYFFPNRPELFTTETMETLINNLAFLIAGPGSYDADVEWVQVFKGKGGFSQGREIACVLGQRWMISHLVPIKSEMEGEDCLMTKWVEVPFFTWKNLKALAANLNPPTKLGYHSLGGICRMGSYMSGKYLSDKEAEQDLRKKYGETEEVTFLIK